MRDAVDGRFWSELAIEEREWQEASVEERRRMNSSDSETGRISNEPVVVVAGNLQRLRNYRCRSRIRQYVGQ